MTAILEILEMRKTPLWFLVVGFLINLAAALLPPHDWLSYANAFFAAIFFRALYIRWFIMSIIALLAGALFNMGVAMLPPHSWLDYVNIACSATMLYWALKMLHIRFKIYEKK